MLANAIYASEVHFDIVDEYYDLEIAYIGRYQLLRIVDNLNSSRYTSEGVELKILPFPSTHSWSCLSTGQ